MTVTLLPTKALAHPTNSGALLLELLALAEVGQGRSRAGEGVDSVIALPLLKRLLSAIRFRDRATIYHSRRTGIVAEGISRRLGWEGRQLRVMEVASLLHDLGKIGVPDHILQKPGKLTVDESEFISTQQRVVQGILQACDVDSEVIEIIAHSQGLENSESQDNGLSLGSRILAVADAFDSLTHSQPFRPAMNRADAFKVLEDQSGKQFDRNVVAALERWLESTDAAALDDESSASQLLDASALDEETIRDGSVFWHLCCYLYTLEWMYEAYYIVNAKLDLAVWSQGAAKLFGKSVKSIQGHRWSRGMLFSGNLITGADPLQVTLRTKRSFSSKMSLQDSQQNVHHVDVQTFPIIDPLGDVRGVVELICDDNQAKQQRGQFRQLQMEATRDALTGVFNRGKLDKEAKEWVLEHQSNGKPLSFIYVDLDHFKTINDRLSHVVGDQVLVNVARLLQDELYSGEVLGRYGGEEFVVICPETALQQAVERAERLRRLIAGADIVGRKDLRVTASFGVAELEQGDSVDSVRKRADEALYDAKRGGRNRTNYRQRIARPNTEPTGMLDERILLNSFRTEFHICMASELLTLKLKGFIEEQKAKLGKVAPNKLSFTVGGTSLFGGWGSTLDKQPVNVTIEIREGGPDPRAATAKKHIMSVHIEPATKPTSQESFERRSKFVIEALRSFCMAD